MYDHIRFEHIRESNLKDISVEIPYHKHTVIAGVSGSGKSALAYDVIYATAQRRLLDCMSDREKIFSRKMKQPRTGNIEGLSAVISLKQVRPNTNPQVHRGYLHKHRIFRQEPDSYTRQMPLPVLQ